MSVKIFFCYAHEDEALLNKLKSHLMPLQRKGLIETWNDRDISAGTKWEEEIDRHLNEANIILLLISPDFMNSDYCYGIEMQRALERDKRGEARVIPIILRPVYWQDVLGTLQALPTDANPVMSSHWHYQDEAFFDVVKGIRKVIEQMEPPPELQPARPLDTPNPQPTKPIEKAREQEPAEPFPDRNSQARMSTIQVSAQEEVLSQQTEPGVPAAEPASEKIASVPPIGPSGQTQIEPQQSQQRDTVSFHTTPVAPSPGEDVPSDEPRLLKRRFSRRTIIVGLTGIAGLAVAGGSITWLINSHTSGITHPNSIAGLTNIVWQSENDNSGTYQALVDNYNKTNKDNVHVIWHNGPSSTGDLLAIYDNALRARSGSIDVMSTDGVYLAGFASNGWTVPLDSRWPASDRANYFPGPIQWCTYNGQVVAAPLRTDLGILYYRTDIISTPPNTFDDLTNLAKNNASKARYGYVWQGSQYEGLVCDFVEVLAGYGGSVLDPNNSKSVTVYSPEGVQALTEMVSWVGTISPISITTFKEEPSRQAFQNGDAIFMRNWPYAYSLGNNPTTSKVAGKFDIHAIPYGGSGTVGRSCVTGWNMAINAFSKNPDAAWTFMQYMLGPEAQKTLAIKGSFTPTLKSVYNDPDVKAKQPLFTKLAPILQNAVPRPVSPVYADLSNIIQMHIHQALTKVVSPAAALSALQSELQSLVSQ